MRTELRFLLAISLMILVLVGTNIIWPAAPPEVVEPADSTGIVAGEVSAGVATDPASVPAATPGGEPGPVTEQAALDSQSAGVAESPDQVGPTATAESRVRVESPLYDFVFSTFGARLLEARLVRFQSGVEEGEVQLLPPDGIGALGNRLLVGRDTLDYRGLPFQVEPQDGLVLSEGGGPASLTFAFSGSATHPPLELVYTFFPDEYTVLVEGRLDSSGSGVLFTDVGSGVTFNEARRQDEERAMAYVLNHTADGIRTEAIRKFEATQLEPGPFYWAAFKSKYFLVALMAGAQPDVEDARFGGAVAEFTGAPFQADLSVTQPLGAGARYAFRMYVGPQDYQIIKTQGRDFQSVNVYGWRLFRPIIRPVSGIITQILVFLHSNLNIGYGWVLIIFGVIMRIVLFPLNHKAMKAQVRNMAVQPLLQEAQTKYKDNPERMQKELMILYKEHGFNPVAGCLPMLLPWPVLIALFFVFQNTIELRGVPFLWMPDLSVADPLYILPVILALSMFLIQWISMRSMETVNPQMKMMMWMMPIFMLFIFSNLASGLNLYYATANIATLPQQYWIAGERKRAQEQMKVGTKKTGSGSGKKASGK